MSEYAKNIQTIEDMWKKRIELQEGGGGRMRQPKKDHAAPKQKQSAVEYIWEQRGCMQRQREEIVRCRDCKYYMDYEYEYEPNLGYCRLHDMEEVKDSRFCAWAERREP